jgi:hypothetical protein
MPDEIVTESGWTFSVVPKPVAMCANCGAHLFETNEFLSFMEGKIIWSHLEDTKCDDPNPTRDTVECDDNCGAFSEPNPQSLEEMTAAYEHWHNHGYLSGCSHSR